MNIRPMNGNPMNVRPIYNVNNTNRMNVVRPIIINGVQVGTYMRPVAQMNPAGPSMNPSSTASQAKEEDEEEAESKMEGRKRKITDILDEASKKFREESKKEK